MTVEHKETVTWQKTGGTPGPDGMAQAKNILCSCNWSTGYMPAEDAELLITLHIKRPDASKVELVRGYNLLGVATNLDMALARLRGTVQTVLVESTIDLLVEARSWLTKAEAIK